MTKTYSTNEKLYDVNELSEKLGVKPSTIKRWYIWYNNTPESQIPKGVYLPNPKQSAPRQKRFWTEQDYESLLEFKSMIKRGSAGFMKRIDK